MTPARLKRAQCVLMASARERHSKVMLLCLCDDRSVLGLSGGHAVVDVVAVMQVFVVSSDAVYDSPHL